VIFVSGSSTSDRGVNVPIRLTAAIVASGLQMNVMPPERLTKTSLAEIPSCGGQGEALVVAAGNRFL
jgi:hypothetical protein